MTLPLLDGVPTAPLAAWLDGRRAARLDALLATHRPLVDEGAAAIDVLVGARRPPDTEAAAARTIERVAASLLAALRGDTRGGLERGAAAVDALVRSRRAELLDLPLPRAWKGALMRRLDRFNVALGSYPRWAALIAAAVAPRRAARVHDLASGTGGFARWLAAHPPDGVALDVTASDLDAGYVADGRRLAAEACANVHFEVRDALDLRGLDGIDLFVCTQAAHHLAPGMVARMIAHAVRAAPAGMLLVDLRRGALIAAGALVAGVAVVASPALALDGMQSVRRGWLPSELALLARLAGAKEIDVEPLGPAHVALHARGA